jgi:hypothetical protein
MMRRVRAISLASRFLVTLVVTAVLPLLVYGWFSLRAMREQIDEQVVRVFLPQLAADHAQKIDAHLERTHQACAIVREIARRPLEAAGRNGAADLAGELEAFDEQVELVPDLLDNHVDLLLLANGAGRVLWWADGQRLDPSTHGRRAALIPPSVADKAWSLAAQRDRGVQLVPWGRSELLHRGLEHRSMDPAGHHVGVALAVPAPSGPPGVVFALLRWTEVQQVLDDARQVLVQRAGLPSARVLLASRDGRIVGHTDRSRYGLPLTSVALAQRVASCEAPERSEYVAAAGDAWRIGIAPCTGPAARSARSSSASRCRSASSSPRPTRSSACCWSRSW